MTNLQHVAKNAEHAVESLVLLRGRAVARVGFIADTSHHLSHDDQVNNQR